MEVGAKVFYGSHQVSVPKYTTDTLLFLPISKEDWMMEELPEIYFPPKFWKPLPRPFFST